MATTNRVYCWKDGERLFVEINGATIEAKSFTVEQQLVTLQFQARITVMKAANDAPAKLAVTQTRPAVQVDPLLDECLW